MFKPSTTHKEHDSVDVLNIWRFNNHCSPFSTLSLSLSHTHTLSPSSLSLSLSLSIYLSFIYLSLSLPHQYLSLSLSLFLSHISVSCFLCLSLFLISTFLPKFFSARVAKEPKNKKAYFFTSHQAHKSLALTCH